MTEAEWLAACEPMTLLKHLRKASHRKLRLLVCACCRRAWRLYSDDRNKSAIEIVELYCDGEATQTEVRSAAAAAAEAVQPEKRFHEAATATCFELNVSRFGLRRAVEEAIDSVAYGLSSTDVKSAATGRFLHQPHVEDAEQKFQSAIVRDIFRNPFRPVAFNPNWRTSTVVAIARGMYDSRDFSMMPILSDALQDAGCGNEDILNHCRSDGPHVRGCWVVDLILGKE